MTKQELIERVYRKFGAPGGLTKKAVAEIIDGAFAELGDYFVKSKVTRNGTPRFTYPGFGTFAKRKREARTGRHPQTGELIRIPAGHTLAFAAGSELKSLMNGS
jgi:nucleoid DNA-binding protein